MTKVAQVLRFYSLDEIMEFIKNGGEYPRHNLYCYDQIKESGNKIECIEYDHNSTWNKLGKKINILNLQQQINILKASNGFDVIYAPFIKDVFLLAILKTLHLYKKPILGLGLEVYIPDNKQFVKKLRQKLVRYIYTNGVDSLHFITEKTYQESNKYSPLKSNHDFSRSWGPDVDFCNSFLKQQNTPPTLDYIYSTGGTGRDFKTLIKAFNKIDFDLRITTKKSLDEDASKYLTHNIHINNNIKPGLHSVSLMRNEYYNSLAVALPLADNMQYAPIGLTVLWEALAMGKPVICTQHKLHQFDIEKEKIGFNVGYNDVEGWRQCVNYLINNPQEAKEMGERAKYICKKRYNYKLFSNEIINIIQEIDATQN